MEAREQQNGQVTVRKARPKVISDEEVRELEVAIATLIPVDRYYVDRDEATLTVNFLDVDGERERVFRQVASPFVGEERLFEVIRQSAYDPLFRFQLIQPQYRVDQTERYCTRGAIDGWIKVGTLGCLSDLAKACLPHVGQDSYYDLF